MSRPPSFTPPPGARAYSLRTARGEFAVVDSPVADGVVPKGTALLLPGFTGSKEDFNPLQETLSARGYRTVAVDGRGQYESDGPRDDESAYAQAELAQDALAQAAALGTPVHLVGHSLGGQIARAAVLLDRAPFLSLTLMASGPAQISVSQQQRVKLLRDALAVMSMAEVWEAIQAMEPPEETDTGDLDAGLDDQDDLRRRWLGNKPAQLIATGLQLCVEPDRVADLAAVALPFHVLSGSRDDTWAVPLLDDMALRLRAHRTVVQGAEHSPNTDNPLDTARAFADFWDRSQSR
ncbi:MULTISPECIES: alpha/beta fold hydrolase [unclassified Streptomyces]|uniref:alpha/beta fold hydrolase n=1 Tax=unclassified Streptomyces TaxID=2593676 RepID=UPI00225A6302|nr:MULTISPECIES: alpha/beta hydrolase [unclassified Streptomyces]MCX5050861.1 alpha/beta hydrolase [Streptomyces sp. NBC_00474]MCX5061235.1 alpha/beta hydrolase [Streptomyces sp. NBC_00452]MCX5248768.1 alpha/beta hydrolase [Streptomyces sp. NBC_00201]MCX5293135.1 alpha/beta hydrolase [Streptomyces sp. NBC_00183]